MAVAAGSAPLPTTPYAGMYVDERTGQMTAARTGPHVLVSAPTGGGKTESVLAPACIVHPGAVIAASSKDDLMKLVRERRYGPSYLIDLRQIESPYYGDDVIACRIDPTKLIRRHDDALNMATWLHRVAGLSMGGRITSHDEPYWAYQIIPALAALLWAASPQGNGLGIDWLMHAVENPTRQQEEDLPNLAELSAKYQKLKMTSELEGADDQGLAAAEAELRAAERVHAAWREKLEHGSAERARLARISAGEDPSTVYQELPPTWWDAREWFSDIPWSVLPTRLERVANLHPRQRDSVGLGMSAALFPWVYQSVRRSELPVFDPISLNDPTASLFILAEPEGGGVGAALPLVQSIVSIWRGKSSLDLLEHNLLIAIDELTNTLPVPTLDVLVSEARGLGINLLVAVQAAQQIAHRYDPIFMETLIRIFPVMLLVYGSAELEVLEQGSLWGGLTFRSSENVDQVTGNRVLSSESSPTYTPQELQPREPYRGRLLYRGSEGIEVKLPSWEQFLHMVDNRTVPGLVRL